MQEGTRQLEETKQFCAVHTWHQVRRQQKEWEEDNGLATLKSGVTLSPLQQVSNLDDLVPFDSTSNVHKSKSQKRAEKCLYSQTCTFNRDDLMDSNELTHKQ